MYYLYLYIYIQLRLYLYSFRISCTSDCSILHLKG
nr:MAG TPA: hypothetical protein [Caudoviricetes sp.]